MHITPENIIGRTEVKLTTILSTKRPRVNAFTIYSVSTFSTFCKFEINKIALIILNIKIARRCILSIYNITG